MMIETMAESKIAVPTAPSRFNLYTASYGLGAATIGAAFNTNLSKPGHANLNVLKLSKNAWNGLIVQMVTNTVKIANGDHALITWPVVYSLAREPSGLGWRIPSKVKISFGCHLFRNSDKQIKLTKAEVTSGNSGPMKLAVKNCVTANDTPATKIAGHVWRMPRMPSIIATNQNGTTTDKIGN